MIYIRSNKKGDASLKLFSTE